MLLIKIYFIIFIIYSMIGWLLEVISTYPDTKCFVNRGFLIGPYCPIYGTCALLMITLLHSFKNIITLFIMSIIICSIAEYITSYLMEKLFDARWWDYSKYKFNLNGRICMQNSLLFGLLGILLIKIINPYIYNYINSLSINTINIVFYIVLIIFIVDLIISFNVILKVKKMSLKYINLDNTKEITEKIKEILNNKLLTRRIIKAFPNIKFNLKKAMTNLKEIFEQS